MSELNEPDVTGASVNPARFAAAMTLGEFASLTALSAATRLNTDTFRRWNRGLVDQPSMQSQVAIESALPVHYSFLTSSGPLPELHAVHFRSLAKAAEFDRARVVCYLQVVAEVAQHLLGNRHVALRGLVSSSRRNDTSAAQSIAAGFRARLGLMHGTAVPNLVDLAESLGVVIAYAPRTNAQIDACSAWTRGKIPLMALNPAKGDLYRQRWDVAHELGHLVMHGDRESMNNRTAEAQADAFAEAFLLPQHRDVRAQLTAAVAAEDGLSSLIEMQEEWGISVDALLYAALRAAPRETRPLVIARQAERREIAPKSEPVGPHRPPEQTHVLGDAVDDVRSSYGTMFASIAHDMGIKSELLATIIARTPITGGGPGSDGEPAIT